MSVLPILTKILCVLPVLNLKANVVPLIPTSNLKGEGSLCALWTRQKGLTQGSLMRTLLTYVQLLFRWALMRENG